MPGKSCACGAIPSACCRKTSWPPTNSTFIDVLSFCTRFAVTIAPRVSCTNNGRILLVNPLQSSRRTFSRGSLLSFLAFKEGMLGTPISVLGVGQQYPGGFLAIAICGKHNGAIRNIARPPQTEYISMQTLLAHHPTHHPNVVLEEHGEDRWLPRKNCPAIRNAP
jgi:hypothetical protein